MYFFAKLNDVLDKLFSKEQDEVFPQPNICILLYNISKVLTESIRFLNRWVALKMPMFCSIFLTEYFLLITPDRKHQYSCMSQARAVKEAESLGSVAVPAISSQRCETEPHQHSGATDCCSPQLTREAVPPLSAKLSAETAKQPHVALGRAISKLLGTVVTGG